jgi:hypothetical protein
MFVKITQLLTMLQFGKTTPFMTEADAQSPFTWQRVETWEASLRQQIAEAAQHGRTEILEILTSRLQQDEAERASFAQKVVRDRLQDEDPAGLPDHHPVHWVQSQLEFRSQGLFEYSTVEAAEQSFQEIRDYLRPKIGRVMVALQVSVNELLDRYIQQICQSLAISLQPELKDRPVVLSEYINSYVPLPRIDLRAVDRFSYFYQEKRLVPRNLVQEVTKTVAPWYLAGLSRKQQICYQLAHQQIIDMVDESLRRSERVIGAQVDGYLQHDLRSQIDRLLASVN